EFQAPIEAQDPASRFTALFRASAISRNHAILKAQGATEIAGSGAAVTGKWQKFISTPPGDCHLADKEPCARQYREYPTPGSRAGGTQYRFRGIAADKSDVRTDRRQRTQAELRIERVSEQILTRKHKDDSARVDAVGRQDGIDEFNAGKYVERELWSVCSTHLRREIQSCQQHDDSKIPRMRFHCSPPNCRNRDQFGSARLLWKSVKHTTTVGHTLRRHT